MRPTKKPKKQASVTRNSNTLKELVFEWLPEEKLLHENLKVYMGCALLSLVVLFVIVIVGERAIQGESIGNKITLLLSFALFELTLTTLAVSYKTNENYSDRSFKAATMLLGKSCIYLLISIIGFGLISIFPSKISAYFIFPLGFTGGQTTFCFCGGIYYLLKGVNGELTTLAQNSPSLSK